MFFLYIWVITIVCVYECVHCRLQTLEMSLPVMMHQHVDNFFKQVRLLWAKEASRNLVDSLFQLRQAVVVLFSAVSKPKQKKYSKTKQKHM